MKCLYVQENCIREISGLDKMTDLRNINLTQNWITKIEGFDNNPQVSSLQIKGNNVGQNGLSDIEYLPKMPALSSLDISDNKIDCEEWDDFVKILEQCKALKVLYLMGNPIVKKIPSYRKTLIARLPTLTFLDDRPVFPEDRIYAEAWFTGGVDAERAARKKWKEDEAAKQRANTLAFREMIDRAKLEHELAQKDGEESSIKSLDTEEKNNLDTYYSSTDKDSSKVLNESDSVNRANQNESTNEKSDSMSQSNNIDDSMSDRIVSTEKSQSNTEKNSETSSVRSNSEAMEDDKENMEQGMYEIPIETQKILQESEYMNDFANNLTELD